MEVNVNTMSSGSWSSSWVGHQAERAGPHQTRRGRRTDGEVLVFTRTRPSRDHPAAVLSSHLTNTLYRRWSSSSASFNGYIPVGTSEEGNQEQHREACFTSATIRCSLSADCTLGILQSLHWYWTKRQRSPQVKLIQLATEPSLISDPQLGTGRVLSPCIAAGLRSVCRCVIPEYYHFLPHGASSSSSSSQGMSCIIAFPFSLLALVWFPLGLDYILIISFYI